VVGPPCLLGLDLGTSITKAALFDPEGHTMAVTSCPSTVISPRPAWSEVDMDDLWSSVCDALRDLRARQPDADIVGMGVCGHVAGVWAIDAQGRPVRRAILWNDGRAASILARWTADGTLASIFDISGNAIFPGYTVAALAWLQEREPDTLDRATTIFASKDWIRYRLTGEIATDESDLSMVPCDARTRTLSRTMLERCGLERHASLFPPVAPSTAVVGHVHAEAARMTGLPVGLPVAAGLADVVASVTGAGAVTAGHACSIVGTSSLNNVIMDSPEMEPVGIGFLFLNPEGRWMRSLANTAGTLNLDWFAANFGAVEAAEATRRGVDIYQVMAAEAARIPLGADGIIYLPYLNTTGVTAPFFDPAARAQFFGLSRTHTRAHLVRAVYEGVALSMLDCYDALPAPVYSIALTGGASRSPFWRQMFADCTGRPVTLTDAEETGARGAALTAGVGAGLYPDLTSAVAVATRDIARYDPNPERHAAYRELYGLYRTVAAAMGESWRRQQETLAHMRALLEHSGQTPVEPHDSRRLAT